MSSRTTRRTAARVGREAARERIVAAAEQLLRERPYRELTVEAVMAEAGLSRTVFYRHFDGLPDVVLSLLGDIEDTLQAVLAGPPGRERTRTILAAAVDMYAEHGPFMRAVTEAASHDAEIEAAYRATVDRFTAVMAGQFEGAMEAGFVARHHPYELARALNLMNGHYLVETLGRDPGFDRRLALDTLLAVWDAVTSHSSSSPSPG